MVLAGIGMWTSFYTIPAESEGVMLRFGKYIDKVPPGLHFKLPFGIDSVIAVPIQQQLKQEFGFATPDYTNPDQVETFARWRIKDPMQYYLRLRDERSAQSRLEDILGSETRTAIAKHELIEAVRTDKARQPLLDESLTGASTGVGTLGVLHPIRYGRLGIEKGVIDAAAQKLREFGIELLDVRFKRINYHPQVLERIHQRMISERLQIAQRFRSEGEGEAARISGQKERDINEIESTAYKRVQDIRGEADAKATEIYAKAYTQRPEAADFYRFLKSMETYRKIINNDATIVLSTNSDLFALLKRIEQKSRQ
jgi:modulator of FtsH protease HflC